MANVLAAQVAAQAARQTQTAQRPAQRPASLQSQPRPPATLLPMRPAVAQAPSPIRQPAPSVVLPPGQFSTPELDQQFRGAVKAVRNSLAAVAYYGYRLLIADDWPSLGYDSAEHYCEEQGLSEGIWRRYTLLGERLQHLTLADMQQLRVASADALAKVHPDLWPEYAWVEEAKLLPVREFEMLVRQRNLAHQPSQLAEPRIMVSVSVPLSQQSQIERRMTSLRRRAKLATSGDTLLFALEAAERASLLEDVLGAVQLSVAELGRLWKPDEPWAVGLAESAAEKTARLDHGETSSLVDAGARSQQITRAILRALKDLDLQPEEGASDAPNQETIRAASTPERRQAS